MGYPTPNKMLACSVWCFIAYPVKMFVLHLGYSRPFAIFVAASVVLFPALLFFTVCLLGCLFSQPLLSWVQRMQARLDARDSRNASKHTSSDDGRPNQQ